MLETPNGYIVKHASTDSESGDRTVGYFSLSDKAAEVQPYEICGMSRPAVRKAELSQLVEQNPPITASSGPCSRRMLIAAVDANESHLTSL